MKGTDELATRGAPPSPSPGAAVGAAPARWAAEWAGTGRALPSRVLSPLGWSGQRPSPPGLTPASAAGRPERPEPPGRGDRGREGEPGPQHAGARGGTGQRGQDPCHMDRLAPAQSCLSLSHDLPETSRGRQPEGQGAARCPPCAHVVTTWDLGTQPGSGPALDRDAGGPCQPGRVRGAEPPGAAGARRARGQSPAWPGAAEGSGLRHVPAHFPGRGGRWALWL